MLNSIHRWTYSKSSQNDKYFISNGTNKCKGINQSKHYQAQKEETGDYLPMIQFVPDNH